MNSILSQQEVEIQLVNSIAEVQSKLNIDNAISSEVRPGCIGISSQVLITLMGRIGAKLGVQIPNSCYIFYDKREHKQLSIREAAQKFINITTNGR